MNTTLIVFNVLGGLALFLYGLSILSESPSIMVVTLIGLLSADLLNLG